MKHLGVFFCFLITAELYAQTQSLTLFNTLKAYDSLLFEVGFNTCDVAQLEGLIHEDFEFYHDEAGVTLSKTKFLADFKKNVCGRDDQAKRVLDPSSMRTYPLYRNDTLYGAVQTGTHSFWKIEKNKSQYLTSVARFTHLWSLDNESWKLKLVASYDHQ